MLRMAATEADLHDLDQREAEAMAAGDADALQLLWHDDLVVNNPFNVVVTGSQVLERVRGGQLAYRHFERIQEATRVHGDTAVTMGHEVVQPADGTPLAGETVTRRYTHVWLWCGDRWRLVGRHASVVPPR